MRPQIHYEMIFEYEGNAYSDVNYLAVIRTPISKLCNFYLLRAQLPTNLVEDLLRKTGSGKRPNATLKIYEVSETSDERVQLIYGRYLTIIEAHVDRPITYQEQRQHVEIIMSHPILYYLSVTSHFNEYFKNTTAIGALSNFESEIQSKHNILKPVHNVKTSSYEYEQILVKTQNDLHVPNELIFNYKCTDEYAYYFFDDFYLHSDISIGNNEVIGYLNGLTTGKKTYDAKEYFDMGMIPKICGQQPFSDTFQMLDPKNSERTATFHHDMKYEHKKEPTQSSMKKKQPSPWTEFEKGAIEVPSPDGGSPERKINRPSDAKNTSQTNDPKYFARLYAPDSLGKANERFNDSIKKINEDTEYIAYYEFPDCFPDLPQFGLLYNLEFESPLKADGFKFLPLNIVNVFVRKIHRNQFLYHMSKVLMLKLK